MYGLGALTGPTPKRIRIGIATVARELGFHSKSLRMFNNLVDCYQPLISKDKLSERGKANYAMALAGRGKAYKKIAECEKENNVQAWKENARKARDDIKESADILKKLGKYKHPLKYAYVQNALGESILLYGPATFADLNKDFLYPSAEQCFQNAVDVLPKWMKAKENRAKNKMIEGE